MFTITCNRFVNQTEQRVNKRKLVLPYIAQYKKQKTHRLVINGQNTIGTIEQLMGVPSYMQQIQCPSYQQFSLSTFKFAFSYTFTEWFVLVLFLCCYIARTVIPVATDHSSVSCSTVSGLRIPHAHYFFINVGFIVQFLLT